MGSSCLYISYLRTMFVVLWKNMYNSSMCSKSTCTISPWIDENRGNYFTHLQSWSCWQANKRLEFTCCLDRIVPYHICRIVVLVMLVLFISRYVCNIIKIDWIISWMCVVWLYGSLWSELKITNSSIFVKLRNFDCGNAVAMKTYSKSIFMFQL